MQEVGSMTERVVRLKEDPKRFSLQENTSSHSNIVFKKSRSSAGFLTRNQFSEKNILIHSRGSRASQPVASFLGTTSNATDNEAAALSKVSSCNFRDVVNYMS